MFGCFRPLVVKKVCLFKYIFWGDFFFVRVKKDLIMQSNDVEKISSLLPYLIK
jgi:hypothetical protein